MEKPMDFATAILEELKGNTVEVLGPGCNEWVPFSSHFNTMSFDEIFKLEPELHLFSFRFKKNTITVNDDKVQEPIAKVALYWRYGVC